MEREARGERREERGERREERGATPVRARLKKRGGEREERGESGSDTLMSGLESREEGMSGLE